MRHFTFTFDSLSLKYNKDLHQPEQQIKYYCDILNQDINSIRDYIDYFIPNYKILNYNVGTSVSYYSDEELLTQGYMLLVSVLNADVYNNLVNGSAITDEDLRDTIQNNTTIIVFPNKLQLHEGLLNRFPYYDKSPIGVLLCFGSESDLSIKTVSIDDIYYQCVSQEIINYNERDNNWKLFNDSNFSFQNYRLYTNDTTVENTTWSWANLNLRSVNEISSPYGPSLVQRFDPAYIIISLASPEDQLNTSAAEVRNNPNNYLYCRLAGAGSYYIPQLYQRWSFQDKAIDTHGERILLTFASQQLRYYCNLDMQWSALSNFRSYQSYDYKNSIYQSHIQTIHGAIWTNSQLLNHELIYVNSMSGTTIVDTFITDDSAEIVLANVDSHKIPRYNIHINNQVSWTLEGKVHTVLW